MNIKNNIKIICLLGSLSLSSYLHAECVTFPLQTGRFNLPLTQVKVLGKYLPFLVDLGMSHALTVNAEMYELLSKGKDNALLESTDLTGEKKYSRQVKNQDIGLNDFLFKNITINETHEWGLVLSANSKPDLPENTIGLGLFREHGVLHYARKDGLVKWCSHEYPVEAKVQWYPLHIDKEGIHFHLENGHQTLNVVFDTASTHSIVKQSKAGNTVPCADHQNYQCQYLAINKGSALSEESFYVVDLPDEFESDGLLGDSYFQEHDIVVDHIHHRLGVIEHLS